MRLNGEPVGDIHSQENWEPAVYSFTFGADVLEKARRQLPEGRTLQLDFEIPGSLLVGDGPTQRRLGLCLRRLTLTLRE